MKDGIQILTAQDCGADIRFAAEEITFFLGEMGVSAETVQTPTEGRFVSLGATDAAKNLGLLEKTAGMKADGFLIDTVDGNYYIVSPTELGVSFGVYSLLKELCGLEIYAVDVYEMAEIVTFKEVKRKEEPSFEFRDRAWLSWPKYNRKLHRRLRLHGVPFVTPPHSFFTVLPKEKYLTEHPDWYSASTLQLCITNEEMTAQFIENALKIIEEKGFRGNTAALMVGHEDNHSFCNCARCLESDKKYGGHGGTMLRFVNKVAKAVNAYVEEKHPGKTVKTVTFAYGPTVDAPVNENFEPVDPSLKAEKNVGVMFAPLQADYGKSLADEKYNPQTVKMFKGYAALGVEPYIWTYDSVFNDELVYYGQWHNLRKDYDFFKKIGCVSLLDMGHFLPNVAFDALSNYVRMKMMWDLSVDETALIDDFFRAYYREGAVKVRKYFDEINEVCANIDFKMLSYSDRSPELVSKSLWKKETLAGWIQILNEAEALTKDRKATLRIQCEKLTPLSQILDIYAQDMEKGELAAYIQAFENCAAANNLVYLSEVGLPFMRDVDSKLVKWRALLLS